MLLSDFCRKYKIPYLKAVGVLKEKGLFDARKGSSGELDSGSVSLLQKAFKISTETPQKRAPSTSRGLPRGRAPAATAIPKPPEKLKLARMSPIELAKAINYPLAEVMVWLLKRGVVCPRNQALSIDMVRELAESFGISTFVGDVKKTRGKEVLSIYAKPKGGITRPPVVTVVGHVDHGKTTLLDYIRKTRVAAREKGGITQHIGAYKAHTKHGDIVFIDTPGHEAFVKVRERGLRAADIAVLVVAADDGVMPQTIEAIETCKAYKLTVVVAINKIDKATPEQIEKVKSELAQRNLVPEDWGGDTIYVSISAKEGTAIDKLLEMILLQAEMMELRADETLPARCFVIEARLERGLGPSASVICYDGVLKVGDYFECSGQIGKVNVIKNSAGRHVKTLHPVDPAVISGFESLPGIGESLKVIPAGKARMPRREAKVVGTEGRLSGRCFDEDIVNLVLKSGSRASLETLADEVKKIFSRLGKRYGVVASGVGAISDSDISIAYDTESTIIAFGAGEEPRAKYNVARGRVRVIASDIIYRLIEALEKLYSVPAEPEIVSRKMGEATILKIFDIKGVGIVVGLHCNKGVFQRNAKLKVYRGGKLLGEAEMESLQRERKAVKEVHKDQEFAFSARGFDEWAVDDVVECYVEETKHKS